MQALSACTNALRGKSSGGTKLEMCQIEQLKEVTPKAVAQCAIPADVPQATPEHNSANQANQHGASQLHNNFVLEKTPTPNPAAAHKSRRQTRSMTQDSQPSPRVVEQTPSRGVQS